MHSMLGFMTSIWNMPWYWRIWVGLLMLVNGLLSFLFLETIEAKVVLILLMLAAMTQMVIYHFKGFVRLLGVGHFYWFPMLGWLLMKISEGQVPDAVLNWTVAIIILNTASLIIDVLDVVRYWRGEREPSASV